MKKAKARSCLFVGVSQMIFTRIMTLKTPKVIWDYLKEEYAGDDRIRSMQVLNLRREFELQRMNEVVSTPEISMGKMTINENIVTQESRALVSIKSNVCQNENP